jgi:hypothetical protein
MVRIIKDGGLLGIGVEYSKLTKEESKIIHGGYALENENFERINSSQQIIDLFAANVDHIYFNHDAPNKISHAEFLNPKVSNIILIFSIRK